VKDYGKVEDKGIASPIICRPCFFYEMQYVEIINKFNEVLLKPAKDHWKIF